MQKGEFFFYFTENIKEILDYASRLIKERKLINVEASDLANDTLIKMIDSETEFSIAKVKSNIKFLALGEQYYESSHTDYIPESSNGKVKYTEKIKDCCKCHEDLPASYFRVNVFKNGVRRVSPKCFECELKDKKRWFRDNRKIWNEYCRWWNHTNKGVLPMDEYKKKLEERRKLRQEQGIETGNKTAFAKYVANNRDKWNAYLKERETREREQLHDNYIKKTLRGYGHKTSEITELMIIETRERLRIKRLNKEKRLTC